MKNNLLITIALLMLIFSCSQENKNTDILNSSQKIVSDKASNPPVTQVNKERLINANKDSRNWLSHGRTYDEQRYSPLQEINDGNVNNLGLAWYFDIPTRRGMEATSIVVDGRMYVTGSWSIVYAIDASNGKEIWRYDPEVPKEWAKYACCDVVNRGVAAWENNIYFGTLDGYLISLDAETGKVLWRIDTIDRKPPYTITGAPRVIDGLVIIGNGGADYGVRGYVSAYDARNGELRWRFYTVPGNPKNGFENSSMEKAAQTWNGEWWKIGGGGTVWDSMAYDPILDLLYIGVGNGSPWNQKIRSPNGGDNLFLSSIVALRPKTGEYVWHYQTTPGETWDFTATQHMILADISIKGDARKVIMQAPKNGFFYILDRENGELISAEPYVNVNWASHINRENGRPVEAPNARYEDGPFLIFPGPLGAHNWHPMAFNPTNKLIYLPSQEIPFVFGDDKDSPFEESTWNTGTNFELAAAPDDPSALAEIAKMIRGQLVAWDPEKQTEVWRYQHAGPWNGGVLATAGNLVFQGSLIGEFAAYNATTGERVWQFPSQTGIAAAPVSYAVNGEQYISVAVGWGTMFSLVGGEMTASLGLKNYSRILSFKLGGNDALPTIPLNQMTATIPQPPKNIKDPKVISSGKSIYIKRCWSCHGDGAASGGTIPDLRYMKNETHVAWDAIVMGGSLKHRWMPGFLGILAKDESDALHAYVIDRAWLAFNKKN